ARAPPRQALRPQPRALRPRAQALRRQPRAPPPDPRSPPRSPPPTPAWPESPRSALRSSRSRSSRCPCLLCLAFIHDRQDPRDLALCELETRRVLQRARHRLEAEVEQLPPPLREPIPELVVRQVPQFRCARQKSSSSLFTTFDFTE